MILRHDSVKSDNGAWDPRSIDWCVCIAISRHSERITLVKQPSTTRFHILHFTTIPSFHDSNQHHPKTITSTPPPITVSDPIEKKPLLSPFAVETWKRPRRNPRSHPCASDFSQNKSSATRFYVAMLSTVFEAAASDLCPSSAPFFGFMGVAASIIFASRFFGTCK